jgi:multicomponent K+:H+ antiporter subunit D
MAKFALLAPMLDGPIGPGALVLFGCIIAAGFCTVIAMCRAGIQIFWTEPERPFPQARVTEVSAIVLLLGLCLVLTVVARAPLAYLDDTAHQLHAPAHYIHAVLSPLSGTEP